MFARLVQKELLNHLLDFRFVAVLGLCAVLSVLSIYVGARNYIRENQESRAVADANRNFMYQSLVKDGNLWDLKARGYPWSRSPEVLSSVVFGLSGDVGREVHIQYQRLVLFKDSLAAVDPVHALFGVLDFALIVKVILSFCVLLLTHDTVCGEKEAGTLRLYASFSVSRAMLALSKVIGATVAVLVPFTLAFLLAVLVLALSPDVGLQTGDWQRLAALLAVFTLYLAAFAAFGLWVSALTQRRLTAFLGLLGLWTIWIFILPTLALAAARQLAPVESIYAVQKQAAEARWKTRKQRAEEVDAFWDREEFERWDELPEARKQEALDRARQIEDRWDARYHARLKDLQTERRNQMRRQQDLTMLLSAVSPLSALSFASMGLARTGPIQQERLGDALSAYLIYMDRYIQEKWFQNWDNHDLSDFVWFSYRSDETLGECLARNAFHILNLVLLAILGFAGACVAILRYDVR